MELVLLFILSFGSVLVIFSFYLGYFTPVKFKLVETPSDTFAMIPFVGSYKDATTKQVELLSALVKGGLDVSVTAGIYFDDAKQTKDEVCRSLVGVLVKDIEAFKALDVSTFLILALACGDLTNTA